MHCILIVYCATVTRVFGSVMCWNFDKINVDNQIVENHYSSRLKLIFKVYDKLLTLTLFSYSPQYSINYDQFQFMSAMTEPVLGHGSLRGNHIKSWHTSLNINRRVYINEILDDQYGKYQNICTDLISNWAWIIISWRVLLI